MIHKLLYFHEGMGFDLGAINIQRGRDHGIAGYNEVRKSINLPPITSMAQPPAEISGSNWESLSKVYLGKPDDIDLYPAGLAETPLQGKYSIKMHICLGILKFIINF